MKFKKGLTQISKPKFTTGFTLVEVLVVIGIIAVLTVIIFPAINAIKAKNRDAERIADFTTLQLGLSLYYSQHQQYPAFLLDLNTSGYVPLDAVTSPTVDPYKYVPLTKNGSNGKCIYYHLGTTLESSSAQIDTTDTFNSTPGNISNGYQYCGTYTGPGIATGTLNYNVHP